jgi:hypothetical protein
MNRVFVAALLLVSVFARPVHAAGTDRVALDVKSCRTAPDELIQSLPEGFRNGGHYIHLCPVFGPDHKIALYVLTPRLDLMSEDWAFVKKSMDEGRGVSRDTLIFDVNMNIIGSSPGAFPYDPPDMLELTFTDWRKGFPFRIEFDAPANDEHGREHYDPFYWNARAGKFQDKPP